MNTKFVLGLPRAKQVGLEPKECIPLCFQVRLVRTVSLSVSFARSEGWRQESTDVGVVLSHFVECTPGGERIHGNTGCTAEAVQYIDFSSTGVQRIRLVVRVQS